MKTAPSLVLFILLFVSSIGFGTTSLPESLKSTEGVISIQGTLEKRLGDGAMVLKYDGGWVELAPSLLWQSEKRRHLGDQVTIIGEMVTKWDESQQLRALALLPEEASVSSAKTDSNSLNLWLKGLRLFGDHFA